MRISDWSSDVCSSDLSTLMAIGSRRWLDMRLRVVSALVALAFVICPVAATARSAGDLDSIFYHVLKGDTLYLLAEPFLKPRSSYADPTRIHGISDPPQLPIRTEQRRFGKDWVRK